MMKAQQHQTTLGSLHPGASDWLLSQAKLVAMQYKEHLEHKEGDKKNKIKTQSFFGPYNERGN